MRLNLMCGRLRFEQKRGYPGSFSNIVGIDCTMAKAFMRLQLRGQEFKLRGSMSATEMPVTLALT